MTIKETPLMIGVAIISELHEYFKEQRNMERDHIINLSLVIKGISVYLSSMGMPEKEQTKVVSELKEYGKKLWIDSCLETAEKNESEETIREESNYMFDYIFEKHEYPY